MSNPTLPASIVWPVEVTRPGQNFTQIFRGEAVRIVAALTESWQPLSLAGATAEFYWQPSEADDRTRWWTAAATVNGNTVAVVFDAATMDDGSASYRAFFRVISGTSTYRANGVIGMLASPGATPNEIPFPPRVLDFATVTTKNAPWAVDGILKGDNTGGIAAAVPGTDYATPAQTTLSARGFSAWTFSGDTEEGVTYEARQDYEYEGELLWALYTDYGLLSTGDSNSEATEEVFGFGDDQSITATRSALPGYVLGSQTEKPVPKLSDVPAVVAPSTSAADAGKAADAKATGDALNGKLSTSGGTLTGQLNADTVDINAGGDGLSIQDGAALHLNEGSTLDLYGNTAALETWAFDVDDGQGGTETVTKSVAVFSEQE